MFWGVLLPLLLSTTVSGVGVGATEMIPDISELQGEADFRSIRLHWKFHLKKVPIRGNSIPGFVITYCEDQAWGQHRCRNKNVSDSREHLVTNHVFDGDINEDATFAFEITGLKMATNYTVEVEPVFSVDPTDEGRGRGRALMGEQLVIRTKGFSAHAINCLSNTSVVEIETGPNFGGKISVEGSESPECSTEGDALSSTSTYLLQINHALCGSQVQNASVRTFILVQENLPILTHSTRRFMVVCTYVPEILTVRAGVNLPNYVDEGDTELTPVGQDFYEVDPSELFDSSNTIFEGRSRDMGRALKMSADMANTEPERWAHLVLMVVLVMAAVVGVSCAAVQFVKHARQKNRTGFMSPQVEPSAIEANENLEAVVRDFGEGGSGGPQDPTTEPPSVALPFDLTSTNLTSYNLNTRGLLHQQVLHDPDNIYDLLEAVETSEMSCPPILPMGSTPIPIQETSLVLPTMPASLPPSITPVPSPNTFSPFSHYPLVVDSSSENEEAINSEMLLDVRALQTLDRQKEFLMPVIGPTLEEEALQRQLLCNKPLGMYGVPDSCLTQTYIMREQFLHAQQYENINLAQEHFYSEGVAGCLRIQEPLGLQSFQNSITFSDEESDGHDLSEGDDIERDSLDNEVFDSTSEYESQMTADSNTEEVETESDVSVSRSRTASSSRCAGTPEPNWQLADKDGQVITTFDV